MADSDLLARLQVEVILGLPLEESLVPDTEEYRMLRQRLEVEMQARPGVEWEVPFEVPDVVIAAIGTPEEPE